MMYPKGVFRGIAFNPLPTVLVLRTNENYFSTSTAVAVCFFLFKKVFLFLFTLR